MAAAPPGPPAIFIQGDTEKSTGREPLSNSPDFLSPAGVITLHGAGNEIIAFQIILQASQEENALDVRISDLTSGGSIIPARGHVQLFLAHYAQSKNASYDWFPPATAGVEPWKNIDWPDALVPFDDPYSLTTQRVAAPFAIHPSTHRNQIIWADVFVPKGSKPGQYKAMLDVLQNDKPLRTFPIELTVYPFDLPDENHVDAYGELYRETGEMFDSGVKFKIDPSRDWPIYKRYLQMAHAHRFLATHRAENGPIPRTADGGFADLPEKRWGDDWGLFKPYVASILSGELFTEKEYYVGPSAGRGPSFYPAPFSEAFYGADGLKKNLAAHGGKLDPALLETYRANAARFWKLTQSMGWEKTRFFAYIFDEVDAEQDANASAGSPEGDVAALHGAMRDVQRVLDEGSGGAGRIRLIWTSHADAAKWINTSADLRETINWWVPNGHAVDIPFYNKVASVPPTGINPITPIVWFYHSGSPAIGNHTINQTGIDLRLWGLLCWRYQLNGSFLWSMMDFSGTFNDPKFNPYDHPSYRDDDARWGNGTLFYPGSRLTMIGAARNIEGPIPSMRMQAYRRGLQDYEYLWLAAQHGKRAEADALIKQLIPRAFSEAPAGAAPGAWSHNPADYEALRRKLAALIEGN